MRFMMLVIPRGYEAAVPGTMPDADAVAAMMAYNEALQKAGVLIALDGLHPPSMGARVSFSGGRARVVDGPFPDVKEVLGGYWMIDVASKEEAIAWAKQCPMSDGELIEIRQVQELDEFPPDVRQAAEGLSAMQPHVAGACRATHPVVHFEVLGRDGKRLHEFYGALFGWSFDVDNPMQYGLVGPEQAGIGGGVAGSDRGPAVTFYVGVDDASAALTRVERLGGRTVQPPHDVPNGPRIAHFADPEGNVVGLVETRDAPRPVGAGTEARRGG